MNASGFPSHWDIKRMPEVVKWGSGGTPKATENAYYDNGTIPWLVIGDLNDSIVTTSASKITELGLHNSSAKLIPEDTLLVAMYGSIGKLGITGIECCTNQAIAYAKELHGVTTKYIFYFMARMKSELISMGKGGTQKNISQTVLNSLTIPVPPIEEQERIVARIEELFSELDKAVETLQKTKQQLAVCRLAVLQSCLGEGNFYPISECIEDMGQGWSPKCERTAVVDNEQWAVITTTAVQPMRFDYTENKKLPTTLQPREKHELKVGDILITRAGPRSRCGICCMVRETKAKLMNCDKVYRIRVKKDLILPEYFETLLNSPGFQKEIAFCKTGGNDSGVNLTQGRFLGIRIPVPSVAVQKKILLEIESRLTVYDNIEKTVDTALAQADALRQSILKQAFEGRLT